MVASNLAFIAITDITIREIADGGSLGLPGYGLYWPRHIYGQLVRELNKQGATAIAFDVLFSDLRPDLAPMVFTNNTTEPSDLFFGRTMKEAGNVVIGATPGLLPHSFFRAQAHLGDISSFPDDDGVLRRIKPFNTFRVWNENIVIQVKSDLQMKLENAEVRDNAIIFRNSESNYWIPLNENGEFDLIKMTEEILDGMEHNIPETNRWDIPYIEFREWHMGIVMAAHALGLDLQNAEFRDQEVFIPGTNGINRTIPLDNRGFMHINWEVPYPHPNLLEDTMEYQLLTDLERTSGVELTEDILTMFKDRLVFIGSAATGNELTDKGPTPLGMDMFLVSKHWNVASSLMMDRFVVRSGLVFELFVILLLGTLTALISGFLRPPWSTIGILAIAGIYVWYAFSVYISSRIWIPIFVPVAGAVLWNHGMMVAYQVVFEGQERRRIKGVFSKLVSPNVVNELLGQKDLHLGGQRRRITVFFSDVRGFTTMTDEMQKYADDFVKQHGLEGAEAEAFRDQVAQETLETVNTYLAAIADQIKKHNGTLDKYIGDCVMAFWGAPTPNVAHAVSCVRSAVDAQLAMYALNLERASENATIELENERRIERGEAPRPLKRLLVMGSGVNTGEAIVGLMGSEAHIINFTVFGRAVNLASRLEHVSGRSRIIIGEATFRDLEIHDPTLAETCVERDSVHVKGIEDAVRIWEVPWRIYLPDEMNAGGTDPTQVPDTNDRPPKVEEPKSTPKLTEESKEDEAKRFAEATRMTAMLSMKDMSKLSETPTPGSPAVAEADATAKEPELDEEAKRLAADAARVTAMLTRRDFGLPDSKETESKQTGPGEEIPPPAETPNTGETDHRSHDEIVQATAFLARKRFRDAAEEKDKAEDEKTQDSSEPKDKDHA